MFNTINNSVQEVIKGTIVLTQDITSKRILLVFNGLPGGILFMVN